MQQLQIQHCFPLPKLSIGQIFSVVSVHWNAVMISYSRGTEGSQTHKMLHKNVLKYKVARAAFAINSLNASGDIMCVMGKNVNDCSK